VDGVFLFPLPVEQAAFYVFVGQSDASGRRFVAQLAPEDGKPVPNDGSFDVLSGNVVVSSDGSLTDTGLSKDQRRRINDAIDSLETAP
jgi:hypothetical protein